MTYGSLFSGIGGLDLGLDRAGMQCRWQVESDAFCRRILRKHWPHVPKYRDVHAFSLTDMRLVDLIAGGFPCQDISHANQKREGLQGDRSGLWVEFARIIDAIRPRFVLVENVPGLYRNGLGTVLRDLSASGYDAEWDCIPAYPFGSPQQRHRLFILAYTRGERSQGASLATSATGRTLELHRNGPCLDTLRVLRELPVHDPRATHARLRVSGDRGVACGPIRAGTAWATESPLCRVVDGLPHRVDRIKALGNAVVPQIAEWLGRRIMEAAR